MSDSHHLFIRLMFAFTKRIPRSAWGDIRRLVVLAWAVVGLTFSKKVSFSGWGEVVESQAQYAASHARRFSRWMHNQQVSVPVWYAPLVQSTLLDWAQGPRAYLALDASVLDGTGLVLIRVGLIYRGRAIPLAWRVLEHASAMVGFEDYRAVLEHVQQSLPEGLRPTLLADRGFAHVELLQWLHTQGWHYRIRLPGDTLLQRPGSAPVPIETLCPPPGVVHCYHHIALFQAACGPCQVALAQPPAPLTDPWYVVSDERTDVTTLDDYALRFDLEENFLDDKSNGFQAEASELTTPAAWERLFLVLAIAALFFTSIGVGVVKHKLRRWVDPHWERGLSYFKIGWLWLRQHCRRGWPFIAGFYLDPAPDPEPARPSRQPLPRQPINWKLELKT
jgi:hypothetical protein